MNDQKMLTLARNLMRGIREQVFNLDPAACFPCPECAAASAHENYPCAACTVKGLSYIVGTATADHYYRSCVALYRAERAVIRLSQGASDGQEEPVEDCPAGPPAPG